MRKIRLSGKVAKGPLKSVAANDGLADGTVLCEPVLSHILLRDKYLKKVSFIGGRIKHCRFERSNLRNAQFERVDLTGTTFIDCNMQYTAFTQCTLWYVSFRRCLLDYGSLVDSAPREPNLKFHFCRNLRMNAVSLGDDRWAGRLLMLELAAERDEYWNIAVGASNHYRSRYSGIDRFGAAGALVSWWIQKLLWGHGLALSNVAISGLVAVFGFAVLCYASPARYFVRGEGTARALSFVEALYYSLVSFTTGGFGDIMPGEAWARAITSVEGLIGVVFLAFFAAAIYRRLAR